MTIPWETRRRHRDVEELRNAGHPDVRSTKPLIINNFYVMTVKLSRHFFATERKRVDVAHGIRADTA